MVSGFIRYLALPAAVILSLPLGLAPASAEMFGLYQPSYRPLRPPMPVYEAPGPTHPMPFREVALLLHHVGFHAISRIEPRGQTYRVAALDRQGVAVMIVLDAFEGEILDVRPQPRPKAAVIAARPQAGLRTERAMPPAPPQKPAVIAGIVPKPGPQATSSQTLEKLRYIEDSYPPKEPSVLQGVSPTR